MMGASSDDEALRIQLTINREDKEFSSTSDTDSLNWSHALFWAGKNFPASRTSSWMKHYYQVGIHIETLQVISCFRITSLEDQGSHQTTNVLWGWSDITSETEASERDRWRSKGRRVLRDTLILWSAWRWAPDQPCDLKPHEGQVELVDWCLVRPSGKKPDVLVAAASELE